MLCAQDGSGALTYSTDIGSITLPSNLLAWDQPPAIPQGSGATVTILSGSVAVSLQALIKARYQKSGYATFLIHGGFP